MPADGEKDRRPITEIWAAKGPITRADLEAAKEHITHEHILEAKQQLRLKLQDALEYMKSAEYAESVEANKRKQENQRRQAAHPRAAADSSKPLLELPFRSAGSARNQEENQEKKDISK